MKYEIYVKPAVDRTSSKLGKKNRKQLEVIYKKIEEIVQNPHRFKNLGAPLNKWKEVHIDSHFVLAYSINENLKRVQIEDYDHHDRIFR